MYYVAVDIGCIECGEDSAVLGIFTSLEVANTVCNDHGERQAKSWHGQHCFEVYEVEKIDQIIRKDYED